MSTSYQKVPTVPVVIRMPATQQRDQLREVLEAEGYLSLSLWFRQQVVRKLKQTTLVPTPGDVHGTEQN